MTWMVVSAILLSLYSLLLIYYRQHWCAIPAPTKGLPTELPGISVIISARNEEKNIAKCVVSLLNQDYPKDLLQIIVVNDHSEDATEKIVSGINDERLLLLNLSDYVKDRSGTNSYKKRAIEYAITKATGKLIVTTDADCVTWSKWIESIAAFYVEKQAAFIAAPVTFEMCDPSLGLDKKFLFVFQILDFLTLQGITGAAVHSGAHNMCNGANLAYEKKIFEEVGGFEEIDSIASGDDMLLMDKIQRKYPDRIFYLKSKDAIVRTHPEDTWKKFLNQRIRWASKSGKYKGAQIKLVLLLVYLLNVWLFILGIASFFDSQIILLFLSTLLLKIIVELYFLIPVAKFFDQKNLLWWFVPAQPFHILYTIIAGWLGMFGTYQWKGRKVK